MADPETLARFPIRCVVKSPRLPCGAPRRCRMTTRLGAPLTRALSEVDGGGS